MTCRGSIDLVKQRLHVTVRETGQQGEGLRLKLKVILDSCCSILASKMLNETNFCISAFRSVIVNGNFCPLHECTRHLNEEQQYLRRGSGEGNHFDSDYPHGKR